MDSAQVKVSILAVKRPVSAENPFTEVGVPRPGQERSDRAYAPDLVLIIGLWINPCAISVYRLFYHTSEQDIIRTVVTVF